MGVLRNAVLNWYPRYGSYPIFANYDPLQYSVFDDKDRGYIQNVGIVFGSVEHFKQQWHLLRIIHWYIWLPGPLKSQPSNYWGQIDHKLWQRHPRGEYNFVELWVSLHHFIKNVEIGHINNQYIIGTYLLTYMYILLIPENKVYFVFASLMAFASF